MDRNGIRTDVGILPAYQKSNGPRIAFSGMECPYKRLHPIMPPEEYKGKDVKSAGLYERWPPGAGLGACGDSEVKYLEGVLDTCDGYYKPFKPGETGCSLPNREPGGPRNHLERVRFLSNVYSLEVKLAADLKPCPPPVNPDRLESEWDRLVRTTRQVNNSNTIMIEGLSFSVPEAAMFKIFAKFGYIETFTFMYGEGSKPRGVMLVEYAHPKSAMEAIHQMSGHNIEGRGLDVRWSDTPMKYSARNVIKHPYIWLRAGHFYDVRHIGYRRFCQYRGIDHKGELTGNAMDDEKMEEEDARYGYGYDVEDVYQWTELLPATG